MAQKVKVIGGTDRGVFESEINDFIYDKKIIDIQYQSYPITVSYQAGVPCGMVIHDRVLIIYEE